MWRYIWLLPIYLLAGSLPLISFAGSNLEYEYSLLCGVSILILLPIVGVFTPNYLIPGKNSRFSPNISQELFLIVASLVVCLIPGFFMFAIGGCQCSFSGFLFWMILEWLPISMLAHVCYENILRLKLKYDLKFGKALIVCLGHYLVLISVVVFTVILIWWFPQKRASSYVLGFLHGAIYDAGISVDSAILLRQLSYLILSFFLLILVWYKRESNYRFSLVCTGLMFLITYFAGQFLPSTALGKNSLDKQIPYILDEKDFSIHYTDKDATTSSSGLVQPARHVKKLMIEVEFHIEELKNTLKLTDIKKIHIYLYPNSESKKLWLGGRFTDITDIHTPSVHIIIDKNQDWHNTLRHELVHALASNFGMWGLGFHPNMVFTEGLAMALAPSFSDIDQSGIVGSVVSKKGYDVRELFSLNFWKVSSTSSYYVAGSLIKYIIDHYGIDKIKELYSGKVWDKVFLDKSNVVISEWKKEVLKNFNEKEYTLISQNILKHKGVLEEKCPHTKYDYRQLRDTLFLRLRQPLDWDYKTEYWSWRRALDPGDPYAFFRSYNQQAWQLTRDRGTTPVKVESLLKEFDSDYKVINPEQKIENLEDVDLRILRSDILRISSKVDESIQELENVDTKLKELGLKIPNQNLRSITTRRVVESLPIDNTTKLKWRKYLAGWGKIPEYRANEDWIFSYLRVKNPSPSKEEQAVLTGEVLSLMLLKPTRKDLMDSFYEEFYKMVAAKFMVLGEYSKAMYCFSKARKYTQDPGSLSYYDEHLRRADYYQHVKSKFKK